MCASYLSGVGLFFERISSRFASSFSKTVIRMKGFFVKLSKEERILHLLCPADPGEATDSLTD